MQSFGGFFEAYYYHNYLRLPPDTAAQITVDFSVKPNKRGLRLSFRGGICALPGGVRCIVKHIFRAEDLNLKKSIYFDDVLAYNLYEEVCRHRYVRHRSDYADASALCECIRQCSDTRHTLGKTEDFMHRVITIARQYGSRGREIGRAVAELTGSKFYDNNLITMSAQKTGISSDKLVDADEKIPNSVLYTLATGSSIFANTISPSIQPINDRLFFAQSDLIKSLAAQGPLVFVGRCAELGS